MLYRDGCQCRGGDVTKRLTARQSGCLRHKKILADSGSVVRRGHDMSLTLQYEYNIFFFYLNLHCFLCFLNLQGLSNAGQLKETTGFCSSNDFEMAIVYYRVDKKHFRLWQAVP